MATIAVAQPASRTELSLGPVGAAIEADGRLVIAVRLTNASEKTVRGVVVDAIEIQPLSLIATKLPLQIGDLAPEGSAIVRAAFEERGAKVHEYRLVVTGHSVQDGKAIAFRAARLFRPAGPPSSERAKRPFGTPQR